MKRITAPFAVIVVVLLTALSSSVSGQHGPTLSHDLSAHPAGHRGHRIIVQADPAVVASLRGRGAPGGCGRGGGGGVVVGGGGGGGGPGGGFFPPNNSRRSPAIPRLRTS